MSTIVHDFTVGNRSEITITLLSVDVTVVEGVAGAIRVEAEGRENELEQLEAFQTGDMVTVRWRKGGRRWPQRGLSVRLFVPTGAAVTARTASGDVRILTSLSDFDCVAASGDIHLASFSGRARVKTASGDVTIGEGTGGLQVGTASGDVRIDRFDGDARVNTASGDVALGAARGSVTTKTASGDVTIRRFSGVSLEGATMSGDFDIGLAAGMTIDADIRTLSGSFRNLAPAGKGERTMNASIRVNTRSGDIVLR